MKQKLIGFLNQENIHVDGYSIEVQSNHFGNTYNISVDAREIKKLEIDTSQLSLETATGCHLDIIANGCGIYRDLFETDAHLRNQVFNYINKYTRKEIECETCQGIGSIDERLGGYCFSNPEAECPDCDGKGTIEIKQKENVMNEIKLEVGMKYLNRAGIVVEIISNDNDDIYPFNDKDGGSYTSDGHTWQDEDSSTDLISEYVAEVNFNKSEILKAIADDKTIQFRVDEGEPWGDVKDTNWVLRMIGANTQFHLRVKPETIKISDGEVALGDMAWWWGSYGAEYVTVGEAGHGYHWRNAKDWPNLYSIKEPEFEMVKVYKYMKD